MEENSILFEEEKQIKVNLTDASGLVVLFWSYHGAEKLWHPKQEVKKDLWAYTVSLSIFRWKKKAQYIDFKLPKILVCFKCIYIYLNLHSFLPAQHCCPTALVNRFKVNSKNKIISLFSVCYQLAINLSF